ncbi:MAG TPA: 4'-phosphopantetheinyl transferase superfamily protein [Terriglobales bacterium]|jgi:4'-phosphopantetheinyl transferase|nr:4'-phosphopantetheinyl transferase superfamily protein [Terriglobales bacterium]
MLESPATVDALRATGDVHLWTVALDGEALRQEEYWQTLAEDERKRAERFHFVRDRERYVRARGRLRSLLGEYLSQDPANVQFSYGPQDKPAVEGGLQFNLAHSGSYALYAFSFGKRVGMDIEQLRPMDDAEALAQRFFSPEECRDLISLPADQRNAAFFACWTRKEAFVKAVGGGLALPLKSFRVSLLPGEEVCLLKNDNGGKWTLFDVHPAAGYRGAVVVEGGECQLVPMENKFGRKEKSAQDF